MSLACVASAQENPLKCVQRPIAWMVGQQTRIVIETPPDCGELQAAFPKEIEMFDRWPWKKGDTRQRFYFRAKAPCGLGALTLKAGKYQIAVPVRVISWAQVKEPRDVGKLKLPRIFPMVGSDDRKAGPSFMTREELAALRKAGLGGVESIVKSLPPDEKLFYLLGETTIPRHPFVQAFSPQGCPVCGKKIYEGGSAFYPWIIDPEQHPWKVGCPICKRWFPSNDFGAGDMHSGEYPDDGWGYFAPGQKYPYAFIANYVQWSYNGKYTQRVQHLCDYYVRSGDRRIGHSAALAFFRVAEQYYNLSVNLNQRKSPIRTAVAHGAITPQKDLHLYLSYLYIEDNWEVPLVSEYARAFEKLWDFFDQEDSELLAFVQRNSHPEIRTMADFRNFIETGYFRTMAQACMDKAIVGNLPQGQRATLECALFLNTPRSADLVKWVFNGPGAMRYFLTNDYFVDGSAFESQGYNAGHVYNLEEFAQVMEKLRKLNPGKYGPSWFPTLTSDPKYKQIFDFCMDFNLIGCTNAETGDCSDVAGTDPLPRRLTTDVDHKWFAGPYALTKDPRYAAVLYDPKAKSPLPAVTDPDLRAAIEKVVAERGSDIEQPSALCDGYGHAILRAGRGDDRRALWVRYGRARGHQHDDMLTIGWEGKMRKLLPELGYPHFWEHRAEWESNWACHYCGYVIGGPYEQKDYWRGPAGHCKLFADGPWARVATAYEATHEDAPAPILYKLVPEQVRERTIALIDLDERDSYAVDIFHAGGGTDNYWSFHGPRHEKEPTLAGLQVEKQSSGTLAGADVAYGQGDAWEKAHPHLNAFPYLYDVRRTLARAPWSLDWSLQKWPDIHLRMTALPASDTDVALARGKPPGGGKPYELEWAVLHTSGAKPHYSQFADVLEVYSGRRIVTDAKRLAVTAATPGNLPPVAVQVSAADRVDTIISCRAPTRCEAGGVASDGAFAVWSEKGGALSAAYLVGGKSLKKGAAGFSLIEGEWRGVIRKVNYRAWTVTIEPAAPYPAGLVGRHVRFTNEFSDCTHLIVAARSAGPNATELKLALDPRIAEGPVEKTGGGYIGSGIPLHLSEMRYCHGKTMTNENNSIAYRLAGVAGQHLLYLDTSKHPNVPAAALTQNFADIDGDGIRRFLVYDYGVGDAAVVAYSVSLQKTGERSWLLESPVGVVLTLPGCKPAGINPGQETKSESLIVTPLAPGKCKVAQRVLESGG